ncbi:MAG: alpha/beta hydrolase, partial [Trueperaceae bacterium]
RPELFRSLSCHEPPLFGVLDDDPESQEMLARDAHTLAAIGKRIAEGDHEGAARQFVEEVIFGPGAWENALPAETRAIMVANAPTFLDELQDPNQSTVDRYALANLEVPTRLTDGTESPPVLARVTDRLVELIPGTTREAIEGAGHVPHLTTPQRYMETMTRA